MAQFNNPPWDDQQWQQQMQAAVTQPQALLGLLELPSSLIKGAEEAWQQFKLKVPPGFIEKMRPKDPQDPLLQQVLPIAKELQAYPGYQQDPLQEARVNPIPGLLHKYQGRVLLTVTGACGIHCRYCFRRHFPYEENNPGLRGWDQALAYVRNNDSLFEVILSGGDPLVADDGYLQRLVDAVEGIPHITTLRIHSRMPIVLPQRITSRLLGIIANTRLQVVLVTHCNHPNELDGLVGAAMACLRQAGATLLNQSVLLQGVNDNSHCLVRLSHQLFAYGILPYYLHLLDKVSGSGHFDVSEVEAKSLWQSLLSQLPGYLVPKLVKEVPTATSKLWLSSSD